MELGLLAGVPLAHALGLASAVVVVLSLVALLLIRGRKGASSAAGGGAAAGGAAAVGGAAAERPADHRPRATILFGTQTGTAERFAKSLRVELDAKYGSHTAFELVDIEAYDYAARLPAERLVLFLMATYGDGEPTDSATGFMEWLAESAAADETGERMKVGRLR